MPRAFQYYFRALMLLVLLHAFNGAQEQDEFKANGYDISLGKTVMSNDATPADETQPGKKSHVLPEHRHNKKFHTFKHYSFKFIPSSIETVRKFVVYNYVQYTEPVSETYTYAFFREINPPPPKA